MQAALQEMVNTQKAILEASKKPDKKLTLVDNRGLAKPSNFDGNSDFLQWKITSAKRWLGQKTKQIQSATHP